MVAVVVGTVVSNRRRQSGDKAADELETTPHYFYNEDFVNPYFTRGGASEEQAAAAPAAAHPASHPGSKVDLVEREMIDSFPGFAEDEIDGGQVETDFNRGSLDGATEAEAALVDELNLLSRRGSCVDESCMDGSQHYFPADGFGFDGDALQRTTAYKL